VDGSASNTSQIDSETNSDAFHGMSKLRQVSDGLPRVATTMGDIEPQRASILLSLSGWERVTPQDAWPDGSITIWDLVTAPALTPRRGPRAPAPCR
jgi:hypothetical protein